MTWNLENLFLPGTKYGPKTQDVYDAKLDGLAAVINEQAPDALGVQEVGIDLQVLDDLESRLNGSWHRHASIHHDPRGSRVAWLSRTASAAIAGISCSSRRCARWVTKSCAAGQVGADLGCTER